MGGHGALTLGLKNPDLYKAISAFAPIVNPIAVPWGQKAFTGYLGNDKEAWKQYDSCELAQVGPNLARGPLRRGRGPCACALNAAGASSELLEKAESDRLLQARPCVQIESFELELEWVLQSAPCFAEQHPEGGVCHEQASAVQSVALEGKVRRLL